jgi:hypothetical protein
MCHTVGQSANWDVTGGVLPWPRGQHTCKHCAAIAKRQATPAGHAAGRRQAWPALLQHARRLPRHVRVNSKPYPYLDPARHRHTASAVLAEGRIPASIQSTGARSDNHSTHLDPDAQHAIGAGGQQRGVRAAALLLLPRAAPQPLHLQRGQLRGGAPYPHGRRRRTCMPVYTSALGHVACS